MHTTHSQWTDTVVCKWSHFECFILLAAHQFNYLLSQNIMLREFKITLMRQRGNLHLNLWNFSMIIPTCRWTLLEMNPKGKYPCSKREKEIHCHLFTWLCTVYILNKLEIKQFHKLDMQWGQRNEPKSLRHVQSCWFANLNNCLTTSLMLSQLWHLKLFKFVTTTTASLFTQFRLP